MIQQSLYDHPHLVNKISRAINWSLATFKMPKNTLNENPINIRLSHHNIMANRHNIHNGHQSGQLQQPINRHPMRLLSTPRHNPIPIINNLDKHQAYLRLLLTRVDEFRFVAGAA